MSDADDEPEAPQPVQEIPNAAEPRAIRRQRDTAQARERRKRDQWRGMLATKEGRAVLWDLLESGDLMGERYPLAGPFARVDPFLAGQHAGEQRIVWRWFLTMVQHDPENAVLLLRENDPTLAAAEKRRRG